MDGGTVLDGSRSIAELGDELFERMLATASGQCARSEIHGYGQCEFVHWDLGLPT